MAYEYGVNLKLNAEKAVKDIDSLLAKLKQMEQAASKVKLNLKITDGNNSAEKQKQEFMRALQQIQREEQKLATQRQLDAQRVSQAEDKTASQRLRNAQKVAQEEEKTSAQKIKNAQRAAREEQRLNTEAEKQAMSVLKANEKVRQEKERTRQEAQRTAQAEQQTARQQQKTSQEAVRTDRERVKFMEDLLKLYSRYTQQKQREEQYARRVAEQEKRATQAAEKRAAAIAKAAAAKQKEALMSQATSGFTTASKRYATVGRSGQIVGSVLNNVAQSMGLVQAAASQLTNNLWNYAQRIGSQILSQVEKIAEGALEQYKTLETAQIGFGNFFYGSPAQFTQQVKEHAEAMPGVGAQDLIRGIQYIAPLAGGNSQLAMNAAEGVMKAILYSGNDVSQFGTNALQNLQQLASGNFTYADIRQMLRAMPTLPKLLASSENGKELLDNGAITTEKLKAYVKKYGQAALLEMFADISETSAAKDIYDKYRKTLSGIIEETGETLKNRWNDAMTHAGIYDAVANFLKNLKDSGAMDKVFTAFGSMIAKIKNYFTNEKNIDQISALLDTIAASIKNFAKSVGGIAKQMGKELGIFNSNGMLNTSGMRDFIRDISQFLKGIVKGFGTGFKVIFDLAKKLANSMGTDGWRKLGEAIGLIASPLGKLITLLTKSGAAAASVLGSLATGLSGVFKWLGSKAAGHLEKLLGTAAVKSAGYSTSGNELMAGALPSMGLSNAAAARFAGFAKWGSGVLRGGLIAGIVQAAGGLTETLIDLSGVFGDAGDDIKAGVRGITNGLSAAVVAFSLAGGGKFGLLLGAVTGLVAGITSYTNAILDNARKAQAKKDEEFMRQVEEASGGYVTQYADYVLETYKSASGKSIDINTEEGRAVYDNLKNYIASQMVKYDEEGNFLGVDPSKLADKFQDIFGHFIDDYKQQLVNSGMVDYTATEGFYNLAQGGTEIDLDKNPQLRDQMADLIRRGLLNGTDFAEGGEYDYTQSNEKIVRDYLQTIGMDTFTTGALKALQEQEALINQGIAPDTDEIKKRVKELDEQNVPQIDTNLQKVVTATEGANTLLKSIDANVAQIAIATGGNIAAMYGLTTDKIEGWDKGYGFAEEFMPWRWDFKYSKLATGNDDPIKYVTDRMSSAAEGYAMKRAFGATDEEKQQASEDWDRVTKAMEELAKIEKNDWGEFKKWLRRYQSYDWAGVVSSYWLASGGVVKDKKVKPVYRAGGGRGVDTVPAYLQPGEFVVRQRAASLAGGSVLSAINNGDLGAAARMLGARFNGSWNNSRSFSRTVNNNQKTVTNNIRITNRTRGGMLNSYYSLANRMASSF